MINVFQPYLDECELEAVRNVLNSKWLGTGPLVNTFTKRFAEYVGALPEELVPLTSCTECIFQSLAALKLNSEDEVVIPTVSYVGVAHAVRSTTAKLVLSDVDPRSLNASKENIVECLSDRTRAIIILHYGGHPGSIREIAELAQKKGIILIEDAACSIGSFAGNRSAGMLGDIGVWSFDSMKILVTGDGGMIRCRLPEISNHIKLSTYLGLELTGFEKSKKNDRWWEINPKLHGRRCRMNDIAAAIGLAQMKRLPQALMRRAVIAAHYNAEFANVEWLRKPPSPGDGDKSSWFFYWIQIASQDRDNLAKHLLNNGIYTTFKYWPLHKTQMYAQEAERFPGAESAAASTLLLPLHQGLSDEEVAQIIRAIKQFQPKQSNRL